MSPRLAVLVSLALLLSVPVEAAWRPDGIPVAIVDGTLGSFAGASDGAGGSFFAWYQFGVADGPATLRVQRLGADGSATWGPSGRVATLAGEGRQFSPGFVVPDGAGGMLVGWHDGVLPFRAQRFDASGRALWEAGGRELAVQPVNYPAQVMPLQGDVLVASDAAQASIVATRYSGSSGAKLWGPVALSSGASGSRSIAIMTGKTSLLAPDGTGGAVATWFDSRGIVAQRVTAGGTALWGPGGALIAPIGPNDGATITGDGTGGAFLLWYRSEGASSSSFIERVRDGVPTWSDGEGVALPWTGTFGSDVVADGAGGAWVLGWRHHFETGELPNMVATRLVDGVATTTVELGPGLGVIRTFARDGGFEMVRIDGSDVRTIRVVRVAADGSLPWGTAGRTVITSPGVAMTSAAAVFDDGLGGLVAGWYDRRTDPFGDLYAARLDADGTLHGVDSAPAVQFLAADPTPSSTGNASLRFVLAKPANVTLKLFDVRGRIVRRLVNGDALPAGERAALWDGKDDDGRAVGSGLYFVDLRVGDGRAFGRIVITR